MLQAASTELIFIFIIKGKFAEKLTQKQTSSSCSTGSVELKESLARA
ncbi:hypothetical protein BSU04_27260 [Caballeronia sordidicola]|uniref:Uncharacterized protein n=1 Tax=Caballeronia sordidicola TaxID=196367 RepID=A0A226WVZ3_CABSO|nr:hypothetical protein BSU04_27260 [Caballeronia sordidicola]